ncbi:FAD-dependent monooxygenase [Streptomyces hainanensis]|uniref:Oxygenase n=1 Tax=Streptomyces hainanensis TaxID=402648 RepID=A0A4R4TJF8_9ACTN|nr:FAD-dependent monooxygenase [Streptomyces hainanensis]TDC77877.1 oxygenase [Streptomyces hainanensis]
MGAITTDSEALVVGAGPTGLTMAVELLRRGVDVRVIDRADRRSPHAKAIILQPRALEAFARLGLEDEIRARSLPVRAANYYTHGRRVARINFRRLHGSRFDTPLSLPQDETERILHSALSEAGGRVDYGQRITALEHHPDRVVAHCGTVTHRTTWLLGCDGAHSTVREALEIPFEGATYRQEFALLDGVWETPLAHDEAHYFMDPRGVLVVVGLPGGRTRVFASVPAGGTAADVEESVRGFAAERCPHPLELRERTGAGVFQVHRRIAGRFLAGRVLLAGDAAHVHSPAGGQGLNTGIQDAHEAAWRIAGVLRGALPEESLAQWERERRHVARTVVADTDRQTRLWTCGGWRERLRDLTARMAETTGAIDRFLPARLAQLDLRYPAQGATRGALAAGRRLPDVGLPTGARTHDLLRDGNHLLLAPADRSPLARRPDLTYAPLDGGSTRALGARRPRAVLVRPDGVIAGTARLSDRRALRRLERLLPVEQRKPGTTEQKPEAA